MGLSDTRTFLQSIPTQNQPIQSLTFDLFVLLIKTQLQRAAPVASIHPVDPFLNSEGIMGITISSVSKSPSEKGKHRSLEVSTVTPRSAKEHDTSGRGCCRHGHGR